MMRPYCLTLVVDPAKFPDSVDLEKLCEKSARSLIAKLSKWSAFPPVAASEISVQKTERGIVHAHCVVFLFGEPDRNWMVVVAALWGLGRVNVQRWKGGQL